MRFFNQPSKEHYRKVANAHGNPYNLIPYIEETCDAEFSWNQITVERNEIILCDINFFCYTNIVALWCNDDNHWQLRDIKSLSLLPDECFISVLAFLDRVTI